MCGTLDRRGIHGGNVCALTVHIHSQSEGGRPCSIACCNLVLPTVTVSEFSNSQTCSGDSHPCVSDRCIISSQIDIWRCVGIDPEGETVYLQDVLLWPWQD